MVVLSEQQASEIALAKDQIDLMRVGIHDILRVAKKDKPHMKFIENSLFDLFRELDIILLHLNKLYEEDDN